MIDALTAAIVVLIGAALLLPLLQKSRESASKVKCANRMRQLAISAHNFHDAYKRLPPGILVHTDAVLEKDWRDKDSESYWARAQQTSSLGLIMPFNEMNNLYDKIGPEFYNPYRYFDEFDSKYSYFGKVPGYQEIAVVPSENFACPSDEINKDSLSTIVAIQPITDKDKLTDDFAVILDSDLAKGKFKESWKLKKPVARTNYLACAGAISGGKHPNRKLLGYQGMMTSRHRVRLETISRMDGTANTIMFGESIGGIQAGKRKSAQAWLTSAYGRGRGQIDFGKPADNQTGPILGNEKASSVFGFGSKHPVGVNFATGDAAIVSLKRSIDAKVFYAMTGSNDGEKRGYDKYTLPIRDYKVRAMMNGYRTRYRELENARIRIEMAKDAAVVQLRDGLREIAAYNLKNKDEAEVERAYTEILKLDPTDKQAREYLQGKGKLDSLLIKLKKNGYPKRPFPKDLRMKQPFRRGKREKKMESPSGIN